MLGFTRECLYIYCYYCNDGPTSTAQHPTTPSIWRINRNKRRNVVVVIIIISFL